MAPQARARARNIYIYRYIYIRRRASMAVCATSGVHMDCIYKPHTDADQIRIQKRRHCTLRHLVHLSNRASDWYSGGSLKSCTDTVSERPRRWTRNPLGSARRGSNPLGVVKQSVCLAGADTKQPGAWRAGRVWPVPLIKQSVFDWRYYW